MIFKRASIVHAVIAAWQALRKNPLFFLTASVAGVLISFIGIGVNQQLVSMMSANSFSLRGLQVFSGVLGFLLESLIDYQVLYYSIRIYKGENPSWKSFFTVPSSNFLFVLLARLRFFIIMMLGLIFFIVPGILYICSNYFAGYSILHSLTDSLKKDALMSSTITKHNRWRILLLGLITVIVSLPFSFFGFGTFITPFLLLIDLDVYNQLMEPYEETVTVL
ncbi:hypothetical protein H0W26_06185 [Candidatus Dependentiae bacterium]|nr:hypothetical protein [Candidatus Dependentiae bacterium]